MQSSDRRVPQTGERRKRERFVTTCGRPSRPIIGTAIAFTVRSAVSTGRDLTAIGNRRYSSQMIIRTRTVVAMDGAPIENGAVAFSGNQIVDVGGFDDIKTRNTGEIVDLGEQILLPGLINAH